MPAHRKRPIPPARMVELLADAKRDLLAAGLLVTDSDDPALARRTAKIDVIRGQLRDHLDRLRIRRQNALQAITDGVAVTVDVDELEQEITRTLESLAKADAAFAKRIALLPGMRAFEEQWERAWTQMVAERAWPHNTTERRTWRSAMRATKPEFRATFLGKPSGYQRWRQMVEQVVEEPTLQTADMQVGVAVA